jgi:hypothetical protein
MRARTPSFSASAALRGTPPCSGVFVTGL